MRQVSEVFKQGDLIQGFYSSRVAGSLGEKGTDKELEQEVATTSGLGSKEKGRVTGSWRQNSGQWPVLPNCS